MSVLTQLFEKHFGEQADAEVRLTVSGSNREYYRLQNTKRTIIGVVGKSKEENHAFIEMSKHFKKKNLSVPKLIAVSDNEMCYLEEDLGDISLFDYIKKGRLTGLYGTQEVDMLIKTISQLPEFQIKGAEGFDFSVCYPQPEFDKRTIRWDLNYFKYCFLKPIGLDFQENKLENDFERIAEYLLRNRLNHFMFRDFQSRNVMIKDGEPYFIDYQGGRKGPLYYDVASFIWQAKAQYSTELKDLLLHTYLQSLAKYIEVNENEFREVLNHFILFRLMQVLGAYGFRGYFEKKPHFLQSIPFALENLKHLIKDSNFSDYPYLMNVLDKMTQMKQFQDIQIEKPLVVTIYSFSYKKGIPNDESGNGGGFLFDCRAVNNPGKYERYSSLTGMDKAVIEYLEEDGEIIKLLDNAYQLVDTSVKRYMERKFTHLFVGFGCTGGQHRSVYAAEKMTQHLHQKFGVEVHLIHREQNTETEYKAVKK